MRKTRFTVDQIVSIIQQHTRGAKTADLLRRHGISRETFYRWRKKYGGLEVNDARRMRELEDENRRLKKVIADQALNIDVLKEVLGKKW